MRTLIATALAVCPTYAAAGVAWCPDDIRGAFLLTLDEAGYTAQSLTKLWLPDVRCDFTDATKTAVLCDHQNEPMGVTIEVEGDVLTFSNEDGPGPLTYTRCAAP